MPDRKAWASFKSLLRDQQVVAVPESPPAVLLPESFEDGELCTDHGGKRTGAELWSRARRRVQIHVATKRILGDVQKIYGVDQTTMSQTGAEGELEPLREEALRRTCFWIPDSGFRQKWDVLLVVLLLYISIVAPFRQAFDMPSETWSLAYMFDIIVDIFFICDVFVRPHPTFVDGHSLHVA